MRRQLGEAVDCQQVECSFQQLACSLRWKLLSAFAASCSGGPADPLATLQFALSTLPDIARAGVRDEETLSTSVQAVLLQLAAATDKLADMVVAEQQAK